MGHGPVLCFLGFDGRVLLASSALLCGNTTVYVSAAAEVCDIVRWMKQRGRHAAVRSGASARVSQRSTGPTTATSLHWENCAMSGTARPMLVLQDGDCSAKLRRA